LLSPLTGILPLHFVLAKQKTVAKKSALTAPFVCPGGESQGLSLYRFDWELR
jgi:hypothetical protein